MQGADTQGCLGFLLEHRSDLFPRLDEESPNLGRTWVAAYSPFGALPVQRDDLKFLVSTAPAPKAKAPSEAEQVEKKKAAPGCVRRRPQPKRRSPRKRRRLKTPWRSRSVTTGRWIPETTACSRRRSDDSLDLDRISGGLVVPSAPKKPVVVEQKVDPEVQALEPFLASLEADEEAWKRKVGEARRRLRPGGCCWPVSPSMRS